MMAWSADDGRCCAVSLMLTGLAWGQVFLDLRKTARGASSPAKPALHIPELALQSVIVLCRSSSTASCSPLPPE